MMFVESNRYGACLFLTYVIWERMAIVYLWKHGKPTPRLKNTTLNKNQKNIDMESKSVIDIILFRSLRFKKNVHTHTYTLQHTRPTKDGKRTFYQNVYRFNFCLLTGLKISKGFYAKGL